MTQVLSFPFPPPIRRAPRRDPRLAALQGQQNQQANLYALLQILNQQKQQETTTAQRERQLDISERRFKSEKEERESTLAYALFRERAVVGQGKIDTKLKRHEDRYFRKDVLPVYDESSEKVRSTMQPFYRELIDTYSRDRKQAVLDIDRGVGILQRVFTREFNKGGVHSYGAASALDQEMNRMISIVGEKGVLESSSFKSLLLRTGERNIASRIVSRRELPGVIRTSDEFIPLFQSWADHALRQKEMITDTLKGVSLNDPVGLRNAQEGIRGIVRGYSPGRSPPTPPKEGEERFVADTIPKTTTVDGSLVGTPREYIPDLISSVQPRETPSIRESLRKARVGIVEPLFEKREEGSEVRLGEAIGRGAGAVGIGLGEGAVIGSSLLSRLFNPKLSTITSAFGGLARKDKTFPQILEDLRKMEETRKLVDISAQSEELQRPPRRLTPFQERFLAPPLSPDEEFFSSLRIGG